MDQETWAACIFKLGVERQVSSGGWDVGSTVWPVDKGLLSRDHIKEVSGVDAAFVPGRVPSHQPWWLLVAHL